MSTSSTLPQPGDDELSRRRAARRREVDAVNSEIRSALCEAYDKAPVDDAPRIDSEVDGRIVMAELPAPWPHRNPDDVSVKLPIRVVIDQCMGLGLEIGRYDFDAVDIQMLKQAIATYEHHGGTTKPVAMVRKETAEAAPRGVEV
jgi:hypothetical protein